MNARDREDVAATELPPPVLGRWSRLYWLEVVVLVMLIIGFAWVGARYR